MKFTLKKAKDVTVGDGSGGDYLRGFKDGDTKVRFLTEIDDWDYFEEHFTADNKSFMCLGSIDTAYRSICPGCTSDNEATSRYNRRYGANIYLVDREQVVPFRIPITLYRRLKGRSERNEGTLTDRDYVVIRTGKGLSTEYDVESDDRYPVDLPKLIAQGTEINEVLSESFQEIQGKTIEDFLASATAEPRAAKKKASGFTAEELDEVAAQRRKAEAEDVPPSKPTAAKDDSDSEEVVLTEESVRAMSMPDLYSLAAKAGVNVDDCETKSDIVQTLLDALMN